MEAQQTQNLSVRAAIEERRSIRRFEQAEMDRGDLEEILRLTGLAPSAWNVQPWRFHVITDPDVKQRLRAAAYDQVQVTHAPAVIMVASDMEDVMAHLDEIPHPGMPQEGKERLIKTVRDAFAPQSVEQRGQWGLTQTNIALGFLLLAAQSLGYATVPMLGFDAGQVRQILGLPDHVLFAAMVPVGRPAENGFSHHRHPVARTTTYH